MVKGVDPLGGKASASRALVADYQNWATKIGIDRQPADRVRRN
jgi:hypothetical protein